MDDDIVCYCSNVTRKQIRQAILKGARTLDDIRDMTGACTLGKCKDLSPRKACCSPEIMKILNQSMHIPEDESSYHRRRK